MCSGIEIMCAACKHSIEEPFYNFQRNEYEGVVRYDRAIENGIYSCRRLIHENVGSIESVIWDSGRNMLNTIITQVNKIEKKYLDLHDRSFFETQIDIKTARVEYKILGDSLISTLNDISTVLNDFVKRKYIQDNY